MRARAILCLFSLGLAFCANPETSTQPPEVTPPEASRLSFVVQPVSTNAGGTISVQVAIEDSSGKTLTGASTSVSISLTTGTGIGGAALGGTTTQNAVNGVAIFNNLVITKVGSGFSLTASAGSLTNATSGSFDVAAGAASKLVVAANPTSGSAGGAITPPLQVGVQDAFGNPTTSSTSIHVAITGGTGAAGATLSGTATRSAINGVGTFDDLNITKASAGYTLTATASGLAGVTTTAFTVSPGPATGLGIMVQPGAATAATTISPAPQVAVQDAFGNTVTNASTSVSIGITSGAGTAGAALSGTLVQNAAGGVASFGNLKIDKAGTGYSLTVSASGLTSATTNAFSVTAGSASALAFAAQPSSVVAGSAISPSIQVQVLDAAGNPATTATTSITLAISAGSGAVGAALGGTVTRQAVNGVATFNNLTINKPATNYTLTATATGLSSSTSAQFAVSVGLAAKLVFVAQPSATTTGVAVSPAVQVAVQDALGNTVTGSTATINVAITSGTGAPGAVLGGTVSQAAVNGVAQFGNLTVDKASSGYTLTATSASLTSATSAAFSVADVASKLAFSVQPSTTLAGNVVAPAVQVSVQDAQGSTVASATNSITIAITSGTGTSGAVLGGTLTRAAVNGVATFNNLTIDKPGTGYTLTVTSTGLTSASSSAFAVNAAPTKLGFVVQPSGAGAGGVITPSIQVAVQDAQGATVPGATNSVTLAITSGTGTAGAVLGGTLTRAAVNGVATFNNITVDRAGTGYTLTATATNLTSATSAAFDVAAAAAGCASPQPGWIWCDDFEVDRFASYFEVSDDGGSLTRSSGVGRNGSSGIKMHFAAGQQSAGSLKLAFGRTPSSYFKPADAGTKDYRELYWRVYLKNQTGWTGGGGDKFTRLTIFASSNWAQAMIAHVWTDAAVDANYLLLDPASGTDASGTLKTTQYNDFANLRWLGAARGSTPIFDSNHVGQWYCVESHVKLNTAGQSDGVLEFWVNGQLEASRTGLNWVGNYNAYGLNAILLESYWNAGAPKAQDRFFDDFVVSEQRIGC
ncbi:MAG TPA: hypothetical protein VFT29_08485 [Gemmatimonadaceae bacterium]|nr:hypothetical protein [Gemmatimonadaceae bacterium]